MRRRRRMNRILAVMAAVFSLQTANAAQFVLVNKTDQTVHELYVAACADGHWGHNQILGAPVVTARSFTISDIEPGCYDIMVILPPSNACIISGAALYGTMLWTITWSTVIQAANNECSRAAHIVPAGQGPLIPNYHHW